MVKGVDMHKKIFTGLLLLGLLTVVLASCGIREASPASGPTAKLTGANFLQDTITIKKGESIIFMNESTSPHIIENGAWVGGSMKKEVETGAPTLNMDIAANASATTPPFNTAGTFKLYCPIHPGMNFTVTVVE
jgi:plastocyanin